MRIRDWSSDVCSSDLPEVLRLATLGMAEYLGQDEDLGSIEDGKLADFFLVTADPTKDLKALKAISMVVANGTVYFPSEIYPHFGIKPFAPAPQIVTVPQIGRASCRERVWTYG